MDAEKYKYYHESHMVLNNGTSLGECGLILSSVPLSVFFSMWATYHITDSLVHATEFCFIVLPVIFNVTVLSEYSYLIFLTFIILLLIVFILSVNWKDFEVNLSKKVELRNCITNYRASTNFVVAICILAVDFNIFPRRFAKTETFGSGLMDLGVGFYICCHGLVEKHKNVVRLTSVLRTVLTFLFFGFIRLFLMKIVGYHEHVTEYGVHWNFFFTLAFVKIFVYFISIVFSGTDSFIITVITSIFHEIFLLGGLKEWVFSDMPRDSVLSANKEGLTSCLGFASLYFATSGIAKYISNDNILYRSLFYKLNLACIFTWLGVLISSTTIGISRRVANLGYILWVLSLSLTVIILFLFLELILVNIKKKKKTELMKSAVPYLFKSINANGLFFFIFSNVLTGLINLNFQTFFLTPFMSLTILIVYMIILCTITNYLYNKQIYVKI